MAYGGAPSSWTVHDLNLGGEDQACGGARGGGLGKGDDHARARLGKMPI
jgi:hypothetical protein